MTNRTINLLVKLKNFSIAGKEQVVCKADKKYFGIVKSLYISGYIQSFYIKNKDIYFFLRKFLGKSSLCNLQIFSKPSFSCFLKYKEICRINERKFQLFISTKNGIFTLKECKKLKIGGKILFSC